MSLLYNYYKQDLTQFAALLKDGKESVQVRNGKQKVSKVDANAIDHLGRTVLHIAATDAKHDFIQVLLRHESIDLEKNDRESAWTALHRALYAGNISVAKLLLDHRKLRKISNRDLLSSVDLESNTAFDVYNSTILGVNPASFQADRGGSDLFTFGSNANHTLGFSDADDRSFPERVNLRRIAASDVSSTRFESQRIRDVIMAKYHTIVLTTDATNNIFTCGFAKNGRLGISGGTQFTFQAVAISGHVVAAAAAQDHSLAVTKTGDLYAWGLNTHGQLGFELDGPQAYSSLPRKINRLSKEKVLGVATSNIHSVCFTIDSLYTWGTNDGALGYEIIPTEGKIVLLPRKVTSLSAPVKQVCASRFATTCLLETDDVLVFTNYGFFKLSLQLDRFASQYQVFRPRQAYSPSKVVKVVSGTATIAVQTSMGDVFSFILDESTSNQKPATLAKSIKPSRVWSLRKKHMAIRDVDIGQEGTIVMCTESGLVYTGAKKNIKKTDTTKSEYKFSRVPGITRIVQVRASESGAFGLIRDDVQLQVIEPDATTLSEDLLCTLPYSQLILEEDEAVQGKVQYDSEPNEDDLESEIVVPKHVVNANEMLRNSPTTAGWNEDEESYDVSFQVQNQTVAAHSAICCARSPALKSLLVLHKDVSGIKLVETAGSITTLALTDISCDLGGLVIVLHWIYTDILLTPWIGCPSRDQKRLLSMKEEARKLAGVLQLKILFKALSGSYHAIPKLSLAQDMATLLAHPRESGTADMRLLLEDGEVLTHSVVLAARSEFFGAMIAGAWINARRDDSVGQIVEINVKHISLRVMQVVLKHVFEDQDANVFDSIEFSDIDDYLDFIISVMAAAAELLLARLKQACQVVLARHVHRKNVVIILCEADRYAADELKEGCLDYCARNLQFLMEKSLLDDLPGDLMSDLELHVARKQLERLPISKSGSLVSEMIQRNPDVLEASEVYKERYLASLLVPRSMNPLFPKRSGVSVSKTKGSSASPIVASLNQHAAILDDVESLHLDEPRTTDSGPHKLTISKTDYHESVAKSAPTIEQNTGPLPKVDSTRGWQSSKSASVSTVDLRSALSESLKQTTPKKHADQSWTPVSTARSSQKERRKMMLESPQMEALDSPSASSPVPWGRKKEVPSTPLMAISQAQQATSSKKSSPAPVLPTAMQVPKTARRPSTTPQGPGVTRSQGSYSGSYHGFSPSPGIASGGLSLGEIMAAEQAAKKKMVEYNAVRSMKEIQEQEAFERWFQEESRRVQREEEAALALEQSGSNTKKPKKRGGKAKISGKQNNARQPVEEDKVSSSRSTRQVESRPQGGPTLQANPEAPEFKPRGQ